MVCRVSLCVVAVIRRSPYGRALSVSRVHGSRKSGDWPSMRNGTFGNVPRPEILPCYTGRDRVLPFLFVPL